MNEEPEFPPNQESRPVLGRAVIIMGLAVVLLAVSMIVTVLKTLTRPDYMRDSMDQGEKQEPAQLTDLLVLWSCNCEPSPGVSHTFTALQVKEWKPDVGCYCFGAELQHSVGETWRLGTDVGRRCPEGLIFTIDSETGEDVCAERANQRAEAMNVDEE